ncbi:hypothetical protein [uncultured Sulfitobacter sp.]|uniref:hypothetical protein n=1 Tax=uncultured Sulfitobacter sp. TaxID=191468 RepID=UPI0026205A57|nr:hypothetical protein [uncultured Sulfitobacter sp.]
MIAGDFHHFNGLRQKPLAPRRFTNLCAFFGFRSRITFEDMLYAIGAGLLLGLLSMLVGPKSLSRDAGPTGVFELGELANRLLLDELESGQIFEITVFRQSGNFERAIYVQSRDEALKEIDKLFRRMREDNVRIWANESMVCDVRRPYGSLNGRREGRKTWGCQVEAISEVMD